MSTIEDSFYGSDKLFTLKDASDAAAHAARAGRRAAAVRERRTRVFWA